MFSPSSGQKAATGRFLDVVVKHVELPFKSLGGFFVTIFKASAIDKYPS